MKKLLVVLLLYPIIGFSQISEFIHIDQFGYKIDAPKIGVISNPVIGYNSDQNYVPSILQEIRSADSDELVLTVPIVEWNEGATHVSSGDKGWWFDFSELNISGAYYILDPSTMHRSGTFEISDNPYAEVLKQAGRMFYYNRCNHDKVLPYAHENWTDEINFMNPQQDANSRFIYDPQNASLEKDLSGGWFDAGDYNKYVTFTVSTIHNLLKAYERNPNAFSDSWDIPESGNGIPDILDEVKWELDWLMKMQNNDGSVHIKMGNQNYQENTAYPPSNNFDTRYYGPTCTSAATSLASVFSHAANVYNLIEGLEGYGLTLSEKAMLSFEYALPFLSNGNLDTDCDDGSIVSGDADISADGQLEMMVQAAVYLFKLTGASEYHQVFLDYYNQTGVVVNDYWEYNKIILIDALLEYVELPGANSNISSGLLSSFENQIMNNWEDYYGFSDADLYRSFVPDYSYSWGSNLNIAGAGNLNQEIALLNLGNDSANQFLKASEQLHYFHGINPQGMVYLSNMYEFGGDRCANEIYHSWFWEGSEFSNALTSTYGPAPGFLSGGANQWYPEPSYSPPYGQPPMKSYLDFNDNWPGQSYQITEPAIYYQAAYIRLLSAFVTGEEFVGIANASNDTNPVFKLIPNPAKSIVLIDGLNDVVAVKVYNSIGQELVSTQKSNNQIDVSGLPKGLYLIEAYDRNGIVGSEKLIKN